MFTSFFFLKINKNKKLINFFVKKKQIFKFLTKERFFKFSLVFFKKIDTKKEKKLNPPINYFKCF